MIIMLCIQLRELELGFPHKRGNSSSDRDLGPGCCSRQCRKSTSGRNKSLGTDVELGLGSHSPVRLRVGNPVPVTTQGSEPELEVRKSASNDDVTDDVRYLIQFSDEQNQKVEKMKI